MRSIRWRLVASYVVLTLLAVGLMGVLAASLVKRYAEQQQVDYLSTNAEAIARQARPLMQPTTPELLLDQLAYTSAFLGNARVRVLDTNGQVLADSGPPTESDEFVWIAPTARGDVETAGKFYGTPILIWPRMRPSMIPAEWADLFKELPPGTAITLMRRVDGPWGSRFYFGTRHVWELVPVSPTTSEGTPAQLPPVDTTPRSNRVILARIGDADDPLGYVELSDSPDFSTEALSTTRRAVAFAGGAATLAAAVVGLLVSRGLTAPLRSLTVAAGQMSSGNLATRAQVFGADEIGQLATQFNQMAEGLETSFAALAAERDALRRFTADASHELRTPITALRTFNELLLGSAGDDAAARAEFLAESQTQVERLEWITQNLLDLSRLDAGLVDLEVKEHDAAELLEAAVAPFRTLAEEKDITLTVNPSAEPVGIRCDRRRFELVLSNLLDNALKFTPAGGVVELGAAQGDEAIRLWVQDTGRGIDPDSLPHIFERFYRGQDGETVGNGLGLAIVQSVVQAHGGQVTVESEPGCGSIFVIELPLP